MLIREVSKGREGTVTKLLGKRATHSDRLGAEECLETHTANVAARCVDNAPVIEMVLLMVSGSKGLLSPAALLEDVDAIFWVELALIIHGEHEDWQKKFIREPIETGIGWSKARHDA